ncbi:MAG: hypothetical protein KJ922_03395, partial [Nanoarchaeota archaeon]|nr:hypothetical protein [Nanoarchaeota archaeon]
MPPYAQHGMSIELFYTVLAVFFFFMIYFKTKEMYKLSKHKGIHCFRMAFLFFGLSYLARFLMLLFAMTTRFLFDDYLPRIIMFSITIVLLGYLSTMALFYLIYSQLWKKISHKQFLWFANIIAVTVSIVAFLSRSNGLVTLIQLFMLVFTIILISRQKK